jgi:hypothetical protein
MQLQGNITGGKTNRRWPGGVWAANFVSNSREAFAVSLGRA